MVDIEQIVSFYPGYLHSFKKNLLREYFQYKILEIIFDSKFGDKLSFMGGTAAHIVYQNERFSEDLDFDNMGLKEREFEKLSELIKKKLKLEGYTVETRNVYKRAYHCYIKILDVLFENGISKHKKAKLLIQIDTEPQQFSYHPEKVILNKFDVFCRINVVSPDLLLSQKIYAILNRKRSMGRDFYDTSFLLGKTKPNFDYLESKLKIQNMDELKKTLLSQCNNLDFKYLSKDIEPFLFNSKDSKRVLLFCDYLKTV